MFTSRLQDVRKVQHQLQSIVKQLQRALADEQTSRSAARRQDLQLDEEDVDVTKNVAEMHRTRVQKLQGLHTKSLFRQIPVALSRLERQMARRSKHSNSSSKHSRKTQETSLPRGEELSTIETMMNLAGSSLEDHLSVVPQSANGQVVSGNHIPSSNNLSVTTESKSRSGKVALSDDEGRLGVESTSSSSTATAAVRAVQDATVLVESLHFFEQERVRWYQKQQRWNAAGTSKALKEMARVEQSLRSQHGKSNMSKRALEVELFQHDHYVAQWERAQALQADQNLLDDSVVARPYLSGKIWSSLTNSQFARKMETCTDMIVRSASSSSGGLEERGKGVALVNHPLAQKIVLFYLLFARLVLSVMQQMSKGQLVPRASPRFVVSLPSHSRREGGAASPIKLRLRRREAAAVEDITTMTYASLTLSQFVFPLITLQAEQQEAQGIIVSGSTVKLVLELTFTLQKLASALLVLPRASGVTWSYLPVLERRLLQISDHVVHTIPAAVDSWTPQDASRALISLHALQGLRPDDRVSQMAMIALITKLFPLLASNTYVKLLEKAQQPSLLSFMTRGQRTKLRRQSTQHALLRSSSSHSSEGGSDATKAVLKSVVGEARLRQRQVSAAMREKHLSEFVQKNVRNITSLPLPNIIAVFKLFVQFSFGEKMPRAAAEKCVYAASITAEAILHKISEMDDGSVGEPLPAPDVVALLLVTSAALPFEAQLRRGVRGDVQSKNLFSFLSWFATYLLRCLSAIVAELVDELQTDTSSSNKGAGDTVRTKSKLLGKFGTLGTLSQAFAALDELRQVRVVVERDVSLFDLALQCAQLLRTAFVNDPGLWRRDAITTPRRDEKEERERQIFVSRASDVLMAFSLMDSQVQEIFHSHFL